MSAQYDHIDVEVLFDLPNGWLDDVCASDGDPVIGDARWLADVVRRGLAQALPADATGEVSLLLTDDHTVRALNREFRGLDETTDVLSFSAEHAGEWQGDDDPPDAGSGADRPTHWPQPEGEPLPLGDIIISVPQATRQAGEQGVALHREIALLLVHGALHLLGHDHLDAEPREEMQALEQRALTGLFEGNSGPFGFTRNPLSLDGRGLG